MASPRDSPASGWRGPILKARIRFEPTRKRRGAAPYAHIISYRSSIASAHALHIAREAELLLTFLAGFTMGKRKAAKKAPVKKAKPKLETTFTCLFCNVEGSVSAVLDRRSGIGKITCAACNETWASSIHGLTEPIDLYSEWIDACEAEAAAANA